MINLLKFFAGKIDPAESCHNMGHSEEEYYDCALSDLTHSYDYWSVSKRYKYIYKEFISGLLKAYNKYPNIREKISTFIVYKGYAFDKENRSILNSFMNASARKQEWNLLIDAADNKQCGKAKVYYNYCNNNFIMGEYIHKITLDEIIECQEKPSLQAYEGTIKCINAQSDIMNRIIDLILKEKPIKLKYLDLLERHRVKYIRNAIFAKHGRAFKNEKISNYFKRRYWYKVKADYSDSLLSSIDRENLAIIMKYESKNK